MIEIDSLAPGFSGVFSDSAGGITLLLTASGLSREGDVRRVAWERLRLSQRGTSGFERTLTVTYSFRELASWRRQLTGSAPYGDLASTDVHERSNKVVIEAQSAAAKGRLETLATSLGIPSDAVLVRIAAPRQPMLNIALDQIPGSPGGIVERIDGRPHCTLGYNVKVNGAWYYLTNSHCTGPIGASPYSGMGIVSTSEAYYQPYNNPFWTTNGFVGREELDPALFNSSWSLRCPAGYQCRHSDASLIRYDAGANVGGFKLARVTGYGSFTQDTFNPTWNVYAKNYPLVEYDPIDAQGASSAWHQGTLAEVCVDGAVSATIYLICQDRVYDPSTLGGDSGSPVFILNPYGVPGSQVSIQGLVHSKIGTDRYEFSPHSMIQYDFSSLSGIYLWVCNDPSNPTSPCP